MKLYMLATIALLLSYGAMELPKYKINELSVCWNDCFRKIFKFKDVGICTGSAKFLQ